MTHQKKNTQISIADRYTKKPLKLYIWWFWCGLVVARINWFIPRASRPTAGLSYSIVRRAHCLAAGGPKYFRLTKFQSILYICMRVEGTLIPSRQPAILGGDTRRHTTSLLKIIFYATSGRRRRSRWRERERALHNVLLVVLLLLFLSPRDLTSDIYRRTRALSAPSFLQWVRVRSSYSFFFFFFFSTSTNSDFEGPRTLLLPTYTYYLPAACMGPQKRTKNIYI